MNDATNDIVILNNNSGDVIDLNVYVTHDHDAYVLRSDLADLVRKLWSELTDEQRLALRRECCGGCGSLDTSCQCWNDE